MISLWDISPLTPTPVLKCSWRKRLRNVTPCVKGEDNAKESFLDTAARDFAEGAPLVVERLRDPAAVEAGLAPEEVVRLQLGVEKEEDLTDAQRNYTTKLVAKLQKVGRKV